ncbi:trypsin-like serine peptidase [Kitasatospora sp. NPDC052896]|uniref:trypsin-like serine peptidase n=1 Tax=Kitasatospora sp. NPDC052896 TaxID=3364061 RepID=UPI0037C5AE4D
MTVRTVALGCAWALLLALGAAGCDSGPSGGAVWLPAAPNSGPATWSRERFLKATDRHPGTATPGASPDGPDGPVGALFASDAAGDHLCTASVVDSPGRNLIVTAAHCLYDPGKGARGEPVFVPGYRAGDAPDGVWPLAAITVDRSWAEHGNADLDVAFAVVQPMSGRQVQQLLGANRLGTDPGYQQAVRLTGYPSPAGPPVGCANRTAEQSAGQLRLNCPDHAAGAGGSPWVTGADPVTGAGTVIGVVGGYQQGGDTPGTSYSSYFGGAVRALFARATG